MTSSSSDATQAAAAAATMAAALEEQEHEEQEPPPADGLEPNHVQLIRNTALGVIRNGAQFAEWLQTKRRGDKQYTFLFKGLGHDYYQWCLSNPEECKRLEDAAQERQADDAESDSDASSSSSRSESRRSSRSRDRKRRSRSRSREDRSRRRRPRSRSRRSRRSGSSSRRRYHSRPRRRRSPPPSSWRRRDDVESSRYRRSRSRRRSRTARGRGRSGSRNRRIERSSESRERFLKAAREWSTERRRRSESRLRRVKEREEEREKERARELPSQGATFRDRQLRGYRGGGGGDYERRPLGKGMSSSWNRSPSTRQVAPRPRPKPVKANKMYGWSDDEYVEGGSPRSDGGDNVEHLPAREHVVPNEAKGWYRGSDNRWRRARITTTPVLTVKLDHKGQVVHAKSSAERLAMLKSKLLSGGKTAEGKEEEEALVKEAAAPAAAVSNNEQGVRDLSEGREADTDDTPKASRIKVSVDKRKTRSSTIDEVDGEESRKRRRAGEENKKEEELQVEDKKADDGRSPKRKTSGSPRKEGSSSPSVEARQRQLRAKLLGSKRNSDDGGAA